MADFRALVDVLLGGADAARREGARVLAELRERDMLSEEESDRLSRGIEDAISANRARLETVLAPLRGATRGLLREIQQTPSPPDAPTLSDLEGRIEALEARVAEIAQAPEGRAQRAGGERRQAPAGQAPAGGAPAGDGDECS